MERENDEHINLLHNKVRVRIHQIVLSCEHMHKSGLEYFLPPSS